MIKLGLSNTAPASSNRPPCKYNVLPLRVPLTIKGGIEEFLSQTCTASSAIYLGTKSQTPTSSIWAIGR